MSVSQVRNWRITPLTIAVTLFVAIDVVLAVPVGFFYAAGDSLGEQSSGFFVRIVFWSTHLAWRSLPSVRLYCWRRAFVCQCESVLRHRFGARSASLLPPEPVVSPSHLFCNCFFHGAVHESKTLRSQPRPPSTHCSIHNGGFGRGEFNR